MDGTGRWFAFVLGRDGFHVFREGVVLGSRQLLWRQGLPLGRQPLFLSQVKRDLIRRPNCPQFDFIAGQHIADFDQLFAGQLASPNLQCYTTAPEKRLGPLDPFGNFGQGQSPIARSNLDGNAIVPSFDADDRRVGRRYRLTSRVNGRVNGNVFFDFVVFF